MIEAFTQVGKISKTFGTEGFLKYEIEDPFEDLIVKKSFIFLEIDGSYVPFQILSINERSLKLEWVNDPESAQKYVNSEIYLPSESLPEELTTKELPLFENFKLYDQESNFVGQIVKVEEYPSQIMFHVQRNNGITLIPFHQDMYLSHQQNSLVCALPDGILDL